MLCVFTVYTCVCARARLQGHYLKMQKFLHEQPGAQKTFDVVSQTSALFEVTIRHIQPALVAVAVKGPPVLPVLAFLCVYA